MKLRGVQHNRWTSEKSKLTQVMGKLKDDFSYVYNTETTELTTSSNYDCSKADELDELHTSYDREAEDGTISLTLLSGTCTLFSANYFNVSEYHIRTARNLKKTKGILAITKP